jgi:hypothetical protein
MRRLSGGARSWKIDRLQRAGRSHSSFNETKNHVHEQENNNALTKSHPTIAVAMATTVRRSSGGNWNPRNRPKKGVHSIRCSLQGERQQSQKNSGQAHTSRLREFTPVPDLFYEKAHMNKSVSQTDP